VTESEKIKALVEYRMEQADEALQATGISLGAGLARSAANRAYYAMFYAVLALLATEKKETSRHSAAISLFDLHFVKPAVLPKDFSRWLHDAFALRQQADYASETKVTMEQARAASDHARAFVERTRSLLDERLSARESSSG
jgi:uncharacterized protein (UPF0332 family)